MLTATDRDAGSGFDFAALRAREFARLDRHGLAYLDYAATALYGTSQLRAHHALLARGVFGNPHSESEPSRRSSQLIEHAREQVLAWFGVDAGSHAVVFTHNASAASKLVAESYARSRCDHRVRDRVARFDRHLPRREVGTVRLSLGLANNDRDIDRACAAIRRSIA